MVHTQTCVLGDLREQQQHEPLSCQHIYVTKEERDRRLSKGVGTANIDCCYYQESVVRSGIMLDALCMPFLILLAASQGHMSDTHYIDEETEPQTSFLLSAHSQEQDSCLSAFKAYLCFSLSCLHRKECIWGIFLAYRIVEI